MKSNSPVLVVDDEASVREILVRWLGAAGYQTDEADSADAALERVAARQPAVALCDVEMPVHNGLWLVERLRERYPTVAIVLATAVDTVPGSISLRSGVVAYVLKPFDRTQVLGAVEKAIAWHRAAAGGPRQPAASSGLDDWLSNGDRNRLDE